MNTQERWKPVHGHEDHYEVSSEGRLRSLDRAVTYTDGRVGHFRGRMLSPGRSTEGYLAVALRNQRALVHRLVAEVFLDQSQRSDTVNHINGDKRDNRAVNLEWATFGQNNRHARETGLLNQHGENCNLTRYSEQLVSAMRRVSERYSPTYRELALLFDVSEMQAADIIKGRTRRRA